MKLAVTYASCVFSMGLALLFTPALAQEEEETAATGPVYEEIIYGDANAPVTIVEYASLTCNFCAQFHNSVFPELKKAYIDTGKVRLVFRDFPLDGLAMAGAMLARCAPDNRAQAMLNVMFRQQATWIRAPQPVEPLRSYARLAGMDDAAFDACLENEAIMIAIRNEQEKATNDYKVEATPTFFVDDEKISGFRDFAAMAEVIDRKLTEKGVQ